jgi:hypothetical protein
VSRGRALFIRSAHADIALALAWIPFAAVAFALRDGRQLILLLEVLSAFSFLHQPLTPLLVYGDAEQFGARRRLFVVGPVVLVAAIAVGLSISFTLVAVVGGLWNMEHTLMQRYGFVRIYGRRSGEDDGRLELVMWVTRKDLTLHPGDQYVVERSLAPDATQKPHRNPAALGPGVGGGGPR